MKKQLLLFFLLSACAGGGFTGGGDLAPPGSGGSLDNPPPVVVAGASGAASGTDGVLGSQSSSSDIEVKFFRDYALDFEVDTDIQDIVVERPMEQSAQAYGDATVRKIVGPIKSLAATATISTSNVGVINNQALLLQSWVRAINCGNFPDSEIESLIPPSEQGQPWAQDKLLWLILHLPRPDTPVTVECHNPTYRDFPIESLQKVDLAALKGSPQDIFFFVRVSLSDFSQGGELSLDAEKPLSDEQWLALANKFKLRIVRLLPFGTMSRVHAIPALHLNPN